MGNEKYHVERRPKNPSSWHPLSLSLFYYFVSEWEKDVANCHSCWLMNETEMNGLKLKEKKYYTFRITLILYEFNWIYFIFLNNFTKYFTFSSPKFQWLELKTPVWWSYPTGVILSDPLAPISSSPVKVKFPIPNWLASCVGLDPTDRNYLTETGKRKKKK